ncbi:iron-siderophore ABC transporter substrate-binding protein [Paenibacillus tritici]|uniref:ABC transporter substrate-binding protein n=1 Tax=Paenibacillus tritici TaxID=1873425 RepID=UPI001BAA4D1F|nr:iron-siderophore ABC transporter substrate-binding protein [Paenibacillus tritici]QUL55921.1 iron-siderophore ABC transporter substrate-binding protein [Paenibacillus tritici]
MNRKKSIQILLLAVLLLILAACSNRAGQPASGEQSPSASQTKDQAAAEPGTRTITHLKGEAVIPSKIEKVVVLAAEYIDHLLTIGEKPSGVNTEVRYGGEYLPYLADKLQGVQTVGSADNPNLEAITLLDPDVILIESRTAENKYEQLNKIAPTIVLGNEWLDYGDDTSFWTKDLLTIAEMYDKTDLAKEKIAELEQKTVEASEKIKVLDNKKLAYLRVREKTLQVYAQKGHPTNALLYHDLGFEPAALTPEEQRTDLSLEKTPELGADFIVLETDPNARDFLGNMQKSALWKNIPAVQEGRVHETDSFWLFKGWGVIGRGEIIDEIMAWIEQ